MTTEQDHDQTGGQSVRVSYVPQGFGLALMVQRRGLAEPVPADGDSPDPVAGVLRDGSAVITLEIPRPDGGRSVLSWDPDEVDFDPISREG